MRIAALSVRSFGLWVVVVGLGCSDGTGEDLSPVADQGTDAAEDALAGDGAAASDAPEPDGDTATGEGADCLRNGDCPNGRLCDAGQCVPGHECEVHGELALNVAQSGDTGDGTASLHSYACAGLEGSHHDGPELVYEVTAASDGPLRVTLEAGAASAPLDLAVLSACDGPACVAAAESAVGWAELTVQSKAGEKWLVVVDGRDGASGPFTLIAEGCVPDCEGKAGPKECGDDGCGGSCGECAEGEVCNEVRQCACVPICQGTQGPKECGGDGCGGSCGDCPAGEACDAGGSCVCDASCEDKECGGDGCGGTCGECTGGATCGAGGKCSCVPQCAAGAGGEACGDDGCGGTCGDCADGWECSAGICQCVPKCMGAAGPIECGDDGSCGVPCGICGCGQTCSDGNCEFHGCDEKTCGSDGCGGTCGQCGPGLACVAGQCLDAPCVPACGGKACGSDGCGGSCGVCGCAETCDDETGTCAFHGCDGKVCGSDGCDGACGGCGDGDVCEDGACIPGLCEPQCTGPLGEKQCGDDGCGGACGTCGCGEVCVAGGKCLFIGCAGKACGTDGCGGTCGKCGCGEKCAGGTCAGAACAGPSGPKECGPDGCGGTCGKCQTAHFCESGYCQEGLCEPDCEGKACGDDGCGGSCGTCPAGKGHCVDSQCQSLCPPAWCSGKACGFDPCGAPCGDCPPGQQCVGHDCLGCAPSCAEGAECGDDGCGGTCGTCGCAQSCESGTCVFHGCDAGTGKKQCGTDGCGGSCGSCSGGKVCQDGACVAPVCVPSCTGPPGPKECGGDGCGGSCGSCGCAEKCEAGVCVFLGCGTGAATKQCGSDGCGGTCGACSAGKVCTAGKCVDVTCKPLCSGKVCGDDGCGGSCGICGCGSTCQGGACVFIGCDAPGGKKECGSDGCGGSCGVCKAGTTCTKGLCVPDTCKPSCEGPAGPKKCGADGCGGSCGACGSCETCEGGACVSNACAGKSCGGDGCGGSCGSCSAGKDCIFGQCYAEGECPAPCGPYEHCAKHSCVPGFLDPATGFVWANPAAAGTMALAQAAAHCEALVQGGSEDWHLPVIEQLHALASDVAFQGCGWKAGLYGTCSQYWSSTVSAADATKGWALHFGTGKPVADAVTKPKYVRCVRNVPACSAQCFDRKCGGDGCGGSCGECGCGETCELGKCAFTACKGLACGGDGCGGSCGECACGHTCVSGACVFTACTTPSGQKKECGDDGCGGSCGKCGCGELCTGGQCVFVACQGPWGKKECGDDGCGGTCGQCGPGEACEGSECICVPQCAGKQCGSDACGGSCGQCKGFEVCKDGQCVCVSDCGSKECGVDNCGKICGKCAANEVCDGAKCICIPACAGKVCGPDGCGGSCGQCVAGHACTGAGQCSCVPDCGGRECGSDGCDGICGACGPGDVCVSGSCQCAPACGGPLGPKECGADGCGGLCGECGAGDACKNGYCACVPSCAAPGGGSKECGTDGCGGSCGSCEAGVACGLDGMCGCVPDCSGPGAEPAECGPDGCVGSCGQCAQGEACNADRECVVPASGDRCTAPIAVTSLPYETVGDTTPALSDYAFSPGACAGSLSGGGAGAPDVVYLLMPKVDALVTIELQAGFDARVYVLANCVDGGLCLGAGKTDVQIDASAWSTYYVVVDGAAEGEAGVYTLRVEGSCLPKCKGKECGGDGCGGFCGVCGPGKACNASGLCGDALGDVCAEAPVMGALPFTAASTTAGLADDYAFAPGTCPGIESGGGKGAPDRAFFFVPAGSGKYALALDAGFDAVVYVVEDCGDIDHRCVAAAATKSGKAEVTASLAAGKGYYVVVDGAAAGAAGSFGLTVDAAVCAGDCAGKECGDDGCGGSCGKCVDGSFCHGDGTCGGPLGDSCPDALEVGTLPFESAGDTEGAKDDLAYDWGACPPVGAGWGFGAPDRVFRLLATETGEHSLRLLGPDFEATLYVIGSCDDPDGTCVAGAFAAGGGDLLVEAPLLAGKTYFVVVDGWGGGASGKFVLRIDPPSACKPICQGKACGSNGCGGSCGTCPAGVECNPAGQCSPMTGNTCAEALFAGALPFAAKNDTSAADDSFSFVADACPPETGGGGFGAPDHVWRFEPPAAGLYSIRAAGSFGLLLYLAAACGDVNGSCIGAARAEGGSAELVAQLEAKAAVFVIVDGTGGGKAGAYELTVEAVVCPPDACKGKECGGDGCGGVCGECQAGSLCSHAGKCVGKPGDTCAGAPVVGELPFELSADTTGAADDYAYDMGACPTEAGGWGKSAPDHVFVLVPAASGKHGMSVAAGFQPTVYVVADCAAPSKTCMAGDQNPSGDAKVVVDLAAGKTYYVIVDGWGGGAAGPYTLKVTPPPPCVPDCGGKQCGSDGCGGTCGACSGEKTCNTAGKCAIVAGDDCETAPLVTKLPFAAEGDTSSAEDDLHFGPGACLPATSGFGLAAPDEVFVLEPEQSGLHRLTVSGDFGPAVYVLGSCADPDATCLGGAQAAEGPVELEVELVAGEQYYVVVDGGPPDAAGPYVLEIAPPGWCEPDCTGKVCGSDGCGGSCGLCPGGKVCDFGAGQCVVPDGESCGSSLVIGGLPFVAAGTTSGAKDDHGYSHGACPPEGGGFGHGAPDRAWRFDPQKSGKYAFTVTGSFGPTVYVATDCASINTTCVAGEQAFAGPVSVAAALEAGKTYFVVVDGWGMGAAGSFGLTVEDACGCAGKECGDDGCGGSCGTCKPAEACSGPGKCVPVSGDTCADAATVGPLPFTAAGDTSGASDDYSLAAGACPEVPGGFGFGSPDRVWRFTAPAAGKYLTSVKAAFAPAIYVAKTCASSVQACLGAGKDPPSVAVTLQAGETVFVIVDGTSGPQSAGQYVLAVEKLPCGPDACAGKECGDDGCGGSCGECGAGDTCSAGMCMSPPGGDTCAQAPLVKGVPFQASGTTAGASDFYGYSTGACPPEPGGWGFGAAERVWRFVAPAAAEYTFSMSAAYGTTVYLVANCANVSGTCVAGAKSASGKATVKAALQAGEAVYVIADGYGAGVSGPFVLSIE